MCVFEQISVVGIIMSMSNSLKKLSSCVLLDLDGTLINTGKLKTCFQFLIFLNLELMSCSCVCRWCCW